MFSLYRRHKPRCKLYSKGVVATNCTCPVWGYGGDIQGRQLRVSLKTKDWTLATQRARSIEDGAAHTPAQAKKSPDLFKAMFLFYEDCEMRSVKSSTLRSYKNTLSHFKEWCGSKIKGPAAVTLEDLDAWLKTRSDLEPASIIKEISHLRLFFSFCHQRDWTSSNPALKIRAPKSTSNPTLPFTPAEIEALTLALEDDYTRAIFHCLLYTGLRISDVVLLAPAQITGDRLTLRTAKTGEDVTIVLHPDCVEALSRIEPSQSGYFWDGRMQIDSAINKAREAIKDLGLRARVNDTHPHRFRDTFAVTLILNGEDIRTVQLLLGHTSLKTTEDHYAPFVKAMQRKLDDAVGRLDFRIKK